MNIVQTNRLNKVMISSVVNNSKDISRSQIMTKSLKS